MYKIMLVDDEYLTRDAISKNTPWEEAGFSLVGVAENGKEAIRILEKEEPDLVLTDICMPIMDGLELSGFIHEHYPWIKVVIISGYDDFDYAKQAMRYEVLDYILKPVTSAELVSELKKIYDKIFSFRKNREVIEKIQEDYRKNLPVLKKHFLVRLLSGGYVRKDLKEQLIHFNVGKIGEYQAVFVVIPDNVSGLSESWPEATIDLIYFSIANIIGEMVEDIPNLVFLQDQEERSVCIPGADEESTINAKIETIGKEIIETVKRYLNIEVCILVGETVAGAENWHRSYQDALRGGEYRFLMEEGSFVYGRDFSTTGVRKSIQTDAFVDGLLMAIKLDRKQDIQEITLEIFSCLKESGYEKKTILLQIQNVLLTLLINLEDYVDKFQDEEEIMALTSKMSGFSHIGEMREWFYSLCIELADDIAGRRESANRKIAVLAMDFIEKNYSNMDLSLNNLCTYLGVSTSYFSSVFKETTGETFIEALTGIRMREAKRLLQTSDKKSYEIASEIGYNDPHYFSAIFKKHTGMTPTEYGKWLRKQGGMKEV